MDNKPKILTTTVGSYPAPDWFIAYPSEQTRLDATRVVFDIQRQAGIDLPTDGELYRFDINHPETNGMIEYFLGVLPPGGDGFSPIAARRRYADLGDRLNRTVAFLSGVAVLAALHGAEPAHREKPRDRN